MRSAVLLLAVVLVLVPAASATPPHLPDQERRQIAELAQRYLQHRADKVTNIPQVRGFGVPTTEALRAKLDVDESKLEARRARYDVLPHRGYSRAEVTTDLKRLTVDQDGSVVVHVQEITALYFQESATFSNTSFGMVHVLIFHRTATGWVLAAAMRPPRSKCGMPPETQFCGRPSER